MANTDYDYLNKVGLQYVLNKLKTVIDSNKGNTISVTQEQTSGNKIATITIDGGTPIDIYAPLATNVVVDSAMSDSSTNAVQNKVIKNYIDTQISGITEIDIQTANSFETLPTQGTKGVIYLVPNSGSSPNTKDEYIWDGSSYEKIGTTEVNLDDYVNNNQLKEITTQYIDETFQVVFPTIFPS